MGEENPQASVFLTLIIDTDVLVWYLKKRPEAAAFIQGVSPGERRVSVVSVLELLHGCRNRIEFQDAEEFVEGALDTLIAATALEEGETLATGNVKHFRFIPGLTIKAFIL